MSIENLDDVVAILLAKQAYYRQQLETIEKMITIAQNSERNSLETCPSLPQAKVSAQQTIPWTTHIRDIFADKNSKLTRQQVQDALISRGISEITVAASYNTIVGIMSRLVKNEELVRTPDKRFQRGPRHPKTVSEQLLAELEQR